MKKMKLNKLTLKNFKGVRQFELDASGEDIKVFGDNATGKTTIYDSFIWLLFSKDSQNKSDFQLKTVNTDGEELHGLEHEVEGVFIVDGNELTLRKIFSEKWTKKRGSATKEFTGHSTDYFIDGVPSKKKEFDDKVSSIVDEDAFKLLTSPSFFNEQLHWKKRREIILGVCGDITDQEVIATNDALSGLPDILNNKSIDDLKKIIAAKRSEINKELEKIPVRIDEVQRSVPDVSNLDEKQIDNEIANTKALIEEKEAEISRIKSGGEVSHKEKQLREIETELIDLKNQHHIANNEKVNKKRQGFYQLQERIETLQYDLKKKHRAYSEGMESIEKIGTLTEKLRNEWREVNAQTFEFSGDENCPTCGQALPSDEIEATKEKALAAFNRKKSEKLETINAEGKKYAERLKQIKEENENLDKENADLESLIESNSTELEGLKQEIEAMQADVSDIEDDADYQAKKQEAEAVKGAIEELKSNAEESISKVRNEIVSLKETVHNLDVDKSKFNQVRHSNERMIELQESEKKLAAEYEKLEQQLYLAEEFTRRKVELLEEKINSKFKYARFKLFEQQINGGLEEKCETLYKGVPYSAGLNNAARINVGLDIINTLSEHYQFEAPIFVDNAEAVTKLIDVNSQVISLVVSETDKDLRIDR